MLSSEQRGQFQRDGYLVIPGFKSMEDIARLRERAAQLVDQFDADENRNIFTTQDQEAATDSYFLGSDNTIRCFFEEEAFDETGRLRQAKAANSHAAPHSMRWRAASGWQSH